MNDHYPLDLIHLDFHLWGYMKDLVYQTKLLTGNPRHIVDGTAPHVEYTGCNRRNGPDFGRVFLVLNYTEKPQNTYIQSSGPRTIAVSWHSYLLIGQQQAGVLCHHSTFQYDV